MKISRDHEWTLNGHVYVNPSVLICGTLKSLAVGFVRFKTIYHELDTKLIFNDVIQSTVYVLGALILPIIIRIMEKVTCPVLNSNQWNLLDYIDWLFEQVWIKNYNLDSDDRSLKDRKETIKRSFDKNQLYQGKRS